MKTLTRMLLKPENFIKYLELLRNSRIFKSRYLTILSFGEIIGYSDGLDGTTSIKIKTRKDIDHHGDWVDDCKIYELKLNKDNITLAIIENSRSFELYNENIK